MVIAAATISVGTLHVIVAAVLVVIAASRVVRVSRALGERLHQWGASSAPSARGNPG